MPLVRISVAGDAADVPERVSSLAAAPVPVNCVSVVVVAPSEIVVAPVAL